MATTYTCDRCSKKLTQREDSHGGAHHLIVRDVLPWAIDSSNGGLSNFTTDLCGSCLKDLREFLRPLPQEMPR